MACSHYKAFVKLFHNAFIMNRPSLPGEKMSGLKRMSKDVLLMEPTALQAFKTTSRLLGSVIRIKYKQKMKKVFKSNGDRHLMTF